VLSIGGHSRCIPGEAGWEIAKSVQSCPQGKGWPFEESFSTVLVTTWFHMGYFIVLMSSLLLYNLENSKKWRKTLERVGVLKVLTGNVHYTHTHTHTYTHTLLHSSFAVATLFFILVLSILMPAFVYISTSNNLYLFTLIWYWYYLYIAPFHSKVYTSCIRCMWQIMILISQRSDRLCEHVIVWVKTGRPTIYECT
jgi:hypothetical protein